MHFADLWGLVFFFYSSDAAFRPSDSAVELRGVLIGFLSRFVAFQDMGDTEFLANNLNRLHGDGKYANSYASEMDAGFCRRRLC